MPQLIAMVIVVVGAMIYMFQTFGGTGDKIEGIAQKATVLTEINNIKNGVQLAVRSDDITNRGSGQSAVVTTLEDLADLEYFANQINTEVGDNTGATTSTATTDTSGTLNTYSAISFGGENNPGMLINLVTQNTAPAADGSNITQRPGLRVQFLNELSDNAGFLEAQIATDLEAVASIDRTTVNGAAVALDEEGNVPAANRPAAVAVPTGTAAGTASGNELSDGIFTIYFKDMPANVQQK